MKLRHGTLLDEEILYKNIRITRCDTLHSPLHCSTDVNVCRRKKIHVESQLSSVIERCKLTNGTRPAEVERENCLCCLVYLFLFFFFFYGNALIVGTYGYLSTLAKQAEVYFRLLFTPFQPFVTPFFRKRTLLRVRTFRAFA